MSDAGRPPGVDVQQCPSCGSTAVQRLSIVESGRVWLLCRRCDLRWSIADRRSPSVSAYEGFERGGGCSSRGQRSVSEIVRTAFCRRWARGCSDGVDAATIGVLATGVPRVWAEAGPVCRFESRGSSNRCVRRRANGHRGWPLRERDTSWSALALEPSPSLTPGGVERHDDQRGSVGSHCEGAHGAGRPPRRDTQPTALKRLLRSPFSESAPPFTGGVLRLASAQCASAGCSARMLEGEMRHRQAFTRAGKMLARGCPAPDSGRRQFRDWHSARRLGTESGDAAPPSHAAPRLPLTLAWRNGRRCG